MLPSREMAEIAVKALDGKKGIGQPADILGQNECIICSQVTDSSTIFP